MPVFAATFLGFLLLAASNIVGRVLLALGMVFVAYTGIDLLLSALLGDIVSRMSGLPSLMVQILGVLRVDQAIKLLMSAMLARLTLSGLTSGVVKRLVIT